MICTNETWWRENEIKILYIDQTGQLGGGEIAILPWIKAHSSGAHMVLFEDGPFRALLEEDGIPVDVMDLKALRGVRRESGIHELLTVIPAFISLRKRLARLATGFDILYANSQKAFLLAALSKRRGQPLVWHLRDILTKDHFSALLIKVAVWTANISASIVIANSHATAESFVCAGGLRRKIRVVYDGVDPHPFDKVECSTITSLRQSLGSGNLPLIGLFGRLSPWKGQHVFLEAISRIPEVRGILVGEALFGEDAYVAALQERVCQPDLVNRISFLGFRSDIPALMKSVDIIAHTSIFAEPFGLVIVEGMLAEKPVVATRAGGAMEIIRDGESGLLVSPNSVDELRSAILRLLEDPQEAASIARFGRTKAEVEYSIECMFSGISGVLRSLTVSKLSKPGVV